MKLSRLILVQRWKIEISEVDKVDSDSGRVSINFALTFIKTLKYVLIWLKMERKGWKLVCGKFYMFYDAKKSCPDLFLIKSCFIRGTIMRNWPCVRCYYKSITRLATCAWRAAASCTPPFTSTEAEHFSNCFEHELLLQSFTTVMSSVGLEV